MPGSSEARGLRVETWLHARSSDTGLELSSWMMPMMVVTCGYHELSGGASACCSLLMLVFSD